MTPVEMRKVWDIEAQIERRAHRRRVMWVLGVLAFGLVSLLLVAQGVAWLAHWLGGAL